MGQAGFRSKPQIARVRTEAWVLRELFCPACGERTLRDLPKNTPVGDFDCEACAEQFELKAGTRIGPRVVDGAYGTMIDRLESDTAPNLMLLRYDGDRVRDVEVVPKQFFRPSIIERRKPLGPDARRAGWVGCNIVVGDIPRAGRIEIVRAQIDRTPEAVVSDWMRTRAVRDVSGAARGWLLDVLACVERIGREAFTLDEVYAFEADLSAIYPGNANVRPKIRQQLQVLRDTGLIAFEGRGRYRRRYAI
jgi:type II restriction enzyme